MAASRTASLAKAPAIGEYPESSEVLEAAALEMDALLWLRDELVDEDVGRAGERCGMFGNNDAVSSDARALPSASLAEEPLLDVRRYRLGLLEFVDEDRVASAGGEAMGGGLAIADDRRLYSRC